MQKYDYTLNTISKPLWNELEMDKRIKHIPTITKMGETALKDILHKILVDKDQIELRRSTIDKLLLDPNLEDLMRNGLGKVHRRELAIGSFFNENIDDSLLFSISSLNTPELLTLRNMLKIIIPSIMLLLYIFLFIVIRYIGIPISIIDYGKMMYNSYLSLIKIVLSSLIPFVSFTNILSHIGTTAYVGYQGYSIINSVEEAWQHRNKINKFVEEHQTILEVVNIAEAIWKQDYLLGVRFENLRRVFPRLYTLLGDRLGKKIISKMDKHREELWEGFTHIAHYLGTIDVYTAITSLVRDGGYKFPQFDYNWNGPYIEGLQLIEPLTRYNSVPQPNDIKIGKPNCTIITGANSSGKSTYLRTVVLNIYLAQTLGIICGEELLLTPFHNICTYIDIPNIGRSRDSLFEAEIARCSEILNIINDDKRNVLVIADELFTGTNPDEGCATSIAIAETLANKNNVISFISTHYHNLAKFAENNSKTMSNLHFQINEKDGKYERDYQIRHGYSNQKLGIRLLKYNGMDNNIVNAALNHISIN